MDKRLERVIKFFKEEGMTANAAGSGGGFGGSANAAGPVAGFDPVMGGVQRRKSIGRWAASLRKKKKKKKKNKD